MDERILIELEPGQLGKTNPAYDWKSKMRLKIKKLLPVIITTTFLLNLNIAPANALVDGMYSCTRGVPGLLTENNYLVANNVVTGIYDEECFGSLVIASGVTRIATNVFKDSRSITSVVIPGTVLAIDDGAFWGADGITSLTIGNGVTTIGARAFNGANKITTLNIPNSVTTIGSSAFSGTSRLTSLTLGNQLTTIGLSAFDGSAITSLIIPDSVKTIGDSAFHGARLNSLTLGNQLTTIGDSAFYRNALSSVTLPASLTTLGSMVFENGTLVDVNFLGNAPQNVDANAFFLVNDGARANVAYNATGFGANGSFWNRLIVTYGSAPSGDSGSSKAPVTTPTVVKTADVVFNLKNKKYLSKDALKTKLSKNKSFKRVPEDLYKYSIFNASKKTCVINENYVTGLKKTGTCDLYATRTTTKGVKYKYWVQINYTK